MGLFTEPTEGHACVLCEHFGGDIADGLHALCLYGDRKQVQAQPERGCVHWIRCIGADDEGPIHAGDRTRR